MSKVDQLRALREVKSSRGGGESRPASGPNRLAPEVQKAAVIAPVSAGVASGPREAKRGRPLDVDKAKTLTAIKPWVAAGMSRRTWYRRRAECPECGNKIVDGHSLHCGRAERAKQ